MKHPENAPAIASVRLWSLALALLLFPMPSQATPYASAVSNAAGTVSFILNEDAANVSVVFDNGASTNNLGALGKGPHSFSLGANTAYRIAVSNNSPPGYTSGILLPISDDSTLLRFNSPRGVAINRDPASPYFGRIYVANSAAGTASARSLGDGIYVLNPDFTDALKQGDTALTGGIAFDSTSATGANSPWHIEVGEDGNLYIADFSSTTGTIYKTDPNVSAGSGLNIFEGLGATDAVTNGHGRFGSSVIALGSLAAGNLTVFALEGDLSSINGLRRYDIAAGPLPFPSNSAFAAPTLADPLIRIVNVTVDMDRAPDGKFFLLQNRSVGTETGLYVFSSRDTDGDGSLEPLFDSLGATRAMSGASSDVDLLRISRAVKVAPDGKRAAIIRDDNNIWVIGLTNGIPDLTTRLLVTNTPNTTLGRDISFDAAGNIYAVSSGQGLLRVFSPGGQSTAVTGSDGTFNITVQTIDQFVTVVASEDVASEENTKAGVFTVMRAGPTAAPLTVQFKLSGSASNTLDYAAVPFSVTIPAGASEATVTIKPVDDNISEAGETVVLNLVPGADYGLRVPSNATVTIADNDTPLVSIAATDPKMYERIAADTGTFTVTRLGRTDVALNAAYSLSGSASSGADFEALPQSIAIPVGVTSATVTLRSLDDALVEGDETVTLTLTAGAGYSIGAENSATVIIREDDESPVPANQLLFSDSFDTDSSGKWVVRFGANNLIDGAPDDFDAWFAYDYSADGIPSAPHSANGTFLGLKLRANKNDPTPRGSAGLNLYPLGGNFSGDFALRFDMYLDFAGSSTTEHALAGINHSGDLTNRVTQSADAANTTRGGDGIWFGIVTDASDLRDFGAYTVTNAASLPTLLAVRSASTLTDIFPSPPFAFAGSPANNATSANPKTWADVEISQVGKLVTLKINRTTVLQLTNTTSFNRGNIMLGHNDQFDSVGSPDNYVIFDNVRVVRLESPPPAQPSITGVSIDAAGALQIRFSATGGAASEFALQSANRLAVPTTWTDEAGAAIQSTGPDNYEVTVGRGTGSMRFFRIKR